MVKNYLLNALCIAGALSTMYCNGVDRASTEPKQTSKVNAYFAGPQVFFEPYNDLTAVYSAGCSRSQIMIPENDPTWQAERFSARSAGDYIEYTIPDLIAGPNAVYATIYTSTKSGKYKLSIDGVDVGYEFNAYASAAEVNFKDILFGVVNISTSGSHKFRFTNTTKDGSSTGRDLTLEWMQIISVSATTHVFKETFESGSFTTNAWTAVGTKILSTSPVDGNYSAKMVNGNTLTKTLNTIQTLNHSVPDMLLTLRASGFQATDFFQVEMNQGRGWTQAAQISLADPIKIVQVELSQAVDYDRTALQIRFSILRTNPSAPTSGAIYIDDIQVYEGDAYPVSGYRFTDDFESNNFTKGGWINGGAKISSTTKKFGSYAASLTGKNTLSKSFYIGPGFFDESSVVWTSAYSWLKTSGLEATDKIKVQLFHESSTTPLSTTLLTGMQNGGNWKLMTYLEMFGLRLEGNYTIKFVAEFNDANDFMAIDDFIYIL